jgi:hypothetical protein
MNKYIKWYQTIIDRGKTRTKVQGDGLHRHRIKPGYEYGQYVKENITLLTRQEHRIIHRIRYKIWQQPADAYAFFKLSGRGIEGVPRSEETRRKLSEAQKGIPRYYARKPKSEVTKQRMRKPKPEGFSETCRQVQLNRTKHPMTGKVHSEETKKRMAEARKAYWANRKEAA